MRTIKVRGWNPHLSIKEIQVNERDMQLFFLSPLEEDRCTKDVYLIRSDATGANTRRYLKDLESPYL
jgi:hypothetical protein